MKTKIYYQLMAYPETKPDKDNIYFTMIDIVEKVSVFSNGKFQFRDDEITHWLKPIEQPVSDAVEFYNFVSKKYYKGMNGYVPNGYNAFSSGKTIKDIYKQFLNRDK